MGDILTDLAGEQRSRLVASILGHAERELYATMTAGQRKVLREKVLASVGVYHDFVLDCLRAANKGSVVNEEAMRLLGQIHEAVKR